MTRVAIDAVDIYLQESGTAVQVWVSPVRVSTCNLHGKQVKSGVTGVMPAILIRQFISAAGHFANASNTNTTGSGRSHNTSSKAPGRFYVKIVLYSKVLSKNIFSNGFRRRGIRRLA